MKAALIVDDDPVRHRFFEKHLSRAGYRVVHAYGYHAAVDALCQKQFDLAMLDHDLCIKQKEDGCYRLPYGGWSELTGLDVAKFIAQMPPAMRPRSVIVHSWNDFGAMKMVKLLRSAGVPTEYQMSPA